MKKYKHKHRIYTVVVGKKKHYFLTSIAIAFGIFAICAHFVPVNIGNDINNFYKLSLDASLKTNMLPKGQTLSYKLPGINTVMSMVSPVFSSIKEVEGSGQSVASANTEKKAENEDVKSMAKNVPDIKNGTDYEIDTLSLLNEKRKYNAAGNKPKVLIVHTHGSETYSYESGTGLGKDGSYRTTDEKCNMISIGEIMCSVFKENGINVVHDKTLCDYPTYNTSYVKSLEVIEKNLKKYPDIEFVFDIHRDAIAKDDGTPLKLCCTIDGKSTSQAMIVCGTDAMGLENPHWRENLILALKIQQNLDEMYPGFMRPVNIRRERFNMHKTKGSLLFEVGTHGNTIEEASLAAMYLAKGILETISQ